VNLTPTTPTGIFVLGSMRGIGVRERPGCRRKIIEGKLRPFIGERGFWDGITALSPEGREVSLSDGMELQMAKMLREGYWSDLLDAELDRRALEARLNYQLEARIQRSHG
jgi:hypothetical protein